MLRDHKEKDRHSSSKDKKGIKESKTMPLKQEEKTIPIKEVKNKSGEPENLTFPYTEIPKDVIKEIPKEMVKVTNDVFNLNQNPSVHKIVKSTQIEPSQKIDELQVNFKSKPKTKIEEVTKKLFNKLEEHENYRISDLNFKNHRDNSIFALSNETKNKIVEKTNSLPEIPKKDGNKIENSKLNSINIISHTILPPVETSANYFLEAELHREQRVSTEKLKKNSIEPKSANLLTESEQTETKIQEILAQEKRNIDANTKKVKKYKDVKNLDNIDDKNQNKAETEYNSQNPPMKSQSEPKKDNNGRNSGKQDSIEKKTEDDVDSQSVRRILRSETRKNCEKVKDPDKVEEKQQITKSRHSPVKKITRKSPKKYLSNFTILQNSDQATLNLSHDGAIPVLHISENSHSCNDGPIGSLFDLNDCIELAKDSPLKMRPSEDPLAGTSTPFCDNIDMLREDLNLSSFEKSKTGEDELSFSNCLNNLTRGETVVKEGFISNSASSSLNNQESFSSPSGRRRRRCIVTLID